MILHSLEVDREEFGRRTGWTVKPEGACKGAMCVPLDGADVRAGSIDARVLAARLGMPLIEDAEYALWSLGPETLTGRALTTADAPELVLPDVDGRPFALSALRGQKVVLSTWASWCGCREHLPVWQALRTELHPRGLEVVLVALDTNPEQARPYIERADADHPSLVDRAHVVDEMFGMVNVPEAVWIDEDGIIVRGAEPSLVTPALPRLARDDDNFQMPDLPPDVLEAVMGIDYDNELYLNGLRDWVDRGPDSEWSHPPEDVIARSVPRSDDQARAAAHFELGEALHARNAIEAAQEHWKAAHLLDPDNWTYKRQAWHLVAPDEQGPNDVYDGYWLADVKERTPQKIYRPIRP